MSHQVSFEEAKSYYGKDFSIVCEKSYTVGYYSLTVYKEKSKEVLEQHKALTREQVKLTLEDLKYKYILDHQNILK